jgi:hypothetical protein
MCPLEAPPRRRGGHQERPDRDRQRRPKRGHSLRAEAIAPAPATRAGRLAPDVVVAYTAIPSVCAGNEQHRLGATQNVSASSVRETVIKASDRCTEDGPTPRPQSCRHPALSHRRVPRQLHQLSHLVNQTHTGQRIAMEATP